MNQNLGEKIIIENDRIVELNNEIPIDNCDITSFIHLKNEFLLLLLSILLHIKIRNTFIKIIILSQAFMI